MRKKRRASRHTTVRMEERYGIILHEHERQVIEKNIKQLRIEGKHRTSEIVVLRRQSVSKTIYAILHAGRWVPVVYSNALNRLITTLPVEELEKNNFKPPKLATNKE